MNEHFVISITAADTRVMRKLELLASQNRLLGQATMDSIGEMTAEYAEGPIFMSEGGVLGQRWQPLSDAYAKFKRQHTNLNNLLVFTGKMKASFAWAAEENMVKVGNNAPYFGYHQSSGERKKLPRRAMIGFDDTLKAKIKNRLKSDIQEKLRHI